MRRTILFGMAFAAMLSAAASAQRADPIPAVEGPLIGPVTSEHRAAIAGLQIPYRATFREYPLNSADGRAQATISATAYVRSDVRDRGSRPVFFLFNGGPGASSSPLHFSAFGPRVRTGGQGGTPTQFVDNPDSLLDVADLVFIDPVGTGFSRVLPGGDGASYWAPRGDAAAVLQLVRAWLTENQRTGSPVFFAGESYGGFRLATLTSQAGDLNVAGLLFISPALDMRGSTGAEPGDEQFVFALPSMAAAAWHHRKIERRGRTVVQFVEEATRFAEGEYLTALHQGSALPAEARRRVAERMSRLIGLPAATILEANLRVGNDLFVQALLRDRNATVGRLDSRVSAPVRPSQRADRPAAANDPSLGLGSSNVIRSEAITRYMRDELRVPVQRDYVSLTLDVNFRWNWQEQVQDRGRYFSPLGNVAALMNAKPTLRLMVAGGLYDLAVPVSSARYAIRHADIPLDRATFLTLEAGHSPFDEPATRALFAERVRAFVRGSGS